MTVTTDNQVPNTSRKRRRWPIPVIILGAMVLAAIIAASAITYVGSRPPEPPLGTNGILYRHNPHGGRAPGGYGVASSNGSKPRSLSVGASTIDARSVSSNALTVDLSLTQRSIPGPGESAPSEIVYLRTLHLVGVPLGGTFTDRNVTIELLKIWRSSTTDDLRAYLKVTFHND